LEKQGSIINGGMVAQFQGGVGKSGGKGLVDETLCLFMNLIRGGKLVGNVRGGDASLKADERGSRDRA